MSVMKKHSLKRNNEWIKLKALKFFQNFIRQHTEHFRESEVFSPVANLEHPEQFVARVKRAFSEKEIQERGDKRRNFKNRLDLTDNIDDILFQLWFNVRDRPRVCELISEMIADYKGTITLHTRAREVFPKKMKELQQTLSLTDFEQEILLVCICLRLHLLELPEVRRRTDMRRVDFITKCLNCEMRDVLSAVSNKGRLRRYLCLDKDLDFNQDLLGFLNGINDEPLSNQFFTQQKTLSLPLTFYGDLTRKHSSILIDLIRSGKEHSPVNILLYGAPGTGKTSFASTLAAETRRVCYFINQNTGKDENSRSKPEHRFGALQLCNDQIDPEKSLIVVDEADDMLRGHYHLGVHALFGRDDSRLGDKGLLNMVLDTVKTPTIWIANTSAEELDASSRRRFDYSIKFEPLNATQRLAIWKNNVKKMKLSKFFNTQQLSAFAERYAVSAGGITLTLKNVAKLKPPKGEIESLIEKLMAPHCELLQIPTIEEKFKPARDYSLEGLNINGSVSLERIVKAVRNFRANKAEDLDCPRMNILLSGPPGTGKTEFVKYLGAVLNTRVSVKMGSDILSMFVGGTEQNIKRIFTEAESENTILFLDEIDGLVQRRAGAQRSWEVTQVNELLHQMENFKGILIGATNFIQNLDPAILRRFTFKLNFDWLTDDGKVFFFERMFQSKLNASEKKTLIAIPNLTPGDFRTVRQSFFYLGGTITTADRLAALAQESETKANNPFATHTRVGF